MLVKNDCWQCKFTEANGKDSDSKICISFSVVKMKPEIQTATSGNHSGIILSQMESHEILIYTPKQWR
jgi:hypothetical protein